MELTTLNDHTLQQHGVRWQSPSSDTERQRSEILLPRASQRGGGKSRSRFFPESALCHPHPHPAPLQEGDEAQHVFVCPPACPALCPFGLSFLPPPLPLAETKTSTGSACIKDEVLCPDTFLCLPLRPRGCYNIMWIAHPITP